MSLESYEIKAETGIGIGPATVDMTDVKIDLGPTESPLCSTAAVPSPSNGTTLEVPGAETTPQSSSASLLSNISPRPGKKKREEIDTSPAASGSLAHFRAEKAGKEKAAAAAAENLEKAEEAASSSSPTVTTVTIAASTAGLSVQQLATLAYATRFDPPKDSDSPPVSPDDENIPKPDSSVSGLSAAEIIKQSNGKIIPHMIGPNGVVLQRLRKQRADKPGKNIRQYSTKTPLAVSDSELLKLRLFVRR